MRSRGRPRTADILTPREWEVLALIRDGRSNREIAERLGVSLAGAKFHVSEIISKLGVSSREQAAAWRPGGRSVRLLVAPFALAWRKGKQALRASRFVGPLLPLGVAGLLLVLAWQAQTMLQGGGIDGGREGREEGQKVSVSGMLVRVDGSKVVLKIRDGKEISFTTEGTTETAGSAGWRETGGQAIARLKRGDYVLVSGVSKPDGSQVAERVTVTGFGRRGVVAAIGHNYIDVLLQNGPLPTNQDAIATRIYVEPRADIWEVEPGATPELMTSRRLGLSEVPIGRSVIIEGAFSFAGEPTATRLTVSDILFLQ